MIQKYDATFLISRAIDTQRKLLKMENRTPPYKFLYIFSSLTYVNKFTY